jgi:mxaL protein
VRLRNGRLMGLLLAALLVAGTFTEPRWPVLQPVFRYLFVLDITQSMLVQDYHTEGLPPDRLGYAQEAVRRAIRALPCGSQVGLGLYTTKNMQMLFEPLEICEHLAIIDDVLAHIDWRMAWAANSFVEQGLYSAIRDLKKHDPGIRLVFLTDGQETPPQTFKPQFTEQPGAIRGALVGVGGTRPTRVPRYDRENRLLGYWENADIETPPVSSTSYQDGFQPQVLPREGPYLSWLDEAHLKNLAATTGLRYHRLEQPEALSALLLNPEFAERRPAPTDLRPLLGLAALFLVLAVQAWEPRPSTPRP